MDLTVRIWDRETGVETNRLSGHEGEVYAVAYSPDGSSVVSGGTDKTIRLWDAETGQEKAKFTGKTTEIITIYSLAFSPMGTEILAGCEDKTVRLFDLNLQEIRRFEGMPTAVLCAGFSPDGLYALASGTSNKILVWHRETGNEVQRLAGHRGTVRRAVFLRDHTIFSGSFDRTLALWDLASGAEFKRFANHADAVYCVAASPDGKTAMTGSYDGSVSFWNLR
jgi:tricorn protease-like protein